MSLNKNMRLSVLYQDQIINFEVEYRKRRTMAIQIEPPGKILVVSPLGVPEDIIKRRVRSKGSWIVKKLIQLRDIKLKNPDTIFTDRRQFMFLGKSYLLRILKNGRKIPKVFFIEDRFSMELYEIDYERMKKAMEKWYRKKADRIINDRVEVYVHIIGKRPKVVKVKEQKRRWGSCTARGNLYFNWRCIMAPPQVIDYIVVHEMSHLVHPDHSKRFWQKVESIIPDYKKRRKWLKYNGLRLDI
jgi:predicted metal-dependent hydrolase